MTRQLWTTNDNDVRDYNDDDDGDDHAMMMMLLSCDDDGDDDDDCYFHVDDCVYGA